MAQATQSLFTRNRYLLLGAAAILIIIVGTIIANKIELTPESKKIVLRDLQISEITVGALTNPSEATKTEPKLRQKREYSTADQIALRVVTTPSVNRTIQLTARLIDPTGKIVELQPTTVSFEPGTSTFCCWNFPTAGSFNLQIFRPEQIITSIPVVVRTAANNEPKILIGP